MVVNCVVEPYNHKVMINTMHYSREKLQGVLLAKIRDDIDLRSFASYTRKIKHYNKETSKQTRIRT